MGETIVIPIISGTNVKTKVEYIVGILTGKIDIDGINYLILEDGTEKRYIPEWSLVGRVM